MFFCYYSTADGYPSHLLCIFNQRRSSFIFSTSFIFTLYLLFIHHSTRYFLDLLDEHSPSFRPENKFCQLYIHPLHKQVHRLTNTNLSLTLLPFFQANNTRQPPNKTSSLLSTSCGDYPGPNPARHSIQQSTSSTRGPRPTDTVYG